MSSAAAAAASSSSSDVAPFVTIDSAMSSTIIYLECEVQRSVDSLIARIDQFDYEPTKTASQTVAVKSGDDYKRIVNTLNDDLQRLFKAGELMQLHGTITSLTSRAAFRDWQKQRMAELMDQYITRHEKIDDGSIFLRLPADDQQAAVTEYLARVDSRTREVAMTGRIGAFDLRDAVLRISTPRSAANVSQFATAASDIRQLADNIMLDVGCVQFGLTQSHIAGYTHPRDVASVALVDKHITTIRQLGTLMRVAADHAETTKELLSRATDDFNSRTSWGALTAANIQIAKADFIASVRKPSVHAAHAATTPSAGEIELRNRIASLTTELHVMLKEQMGGAENKDGSNKDSKMDD